MEVLIDKRLLQQYVELNVEIGEIADEAVNNLLSLENVRIKNSADKSFFKEVSLNIDTSEFIDFHQKWDESDIINAALKIYLPLLRNKRIKETFQTQIDEQRIVLALDSMKMEIFEKVEDPDLSRIYFYTVCPSCGNSSFLVSLDKIKSNIFLGCPAEECKFAKIDDILAFFIKKYNESYNDAIIRLKDTFDLDFKYFNSTPYYSTTNVNSINRYGFSGQDLERCKVTLGEGANPTIYRNRGNSSGEFLITNRVMDAMRVRQYNEEVNLVSIFSNSLNQQQIEKILECIPTKASIHLALDKGYDAMQEVDKLTRAGYSNINIINFEGEYNNFYCIKDRQEVINALNDSELVKRVGR